MNLSHHWRLNPDVDFLNHGSFGATPPVVLEVQRRFQDALEADPIQFLAFERDLEPKLDRVRSEISTLVGGVPPKDLVFVRNSTDGVNAVLRSMPLAKGDEIVVTNHGYNACNNAARMAADTAGALLRVAEVPFPIADPQEVVEAIDRQITDRTRILLVDHVTSPTGLVFPIESIVRQAQQRGARVMVDGAHAPGMVPVDLTRLGADYYTANHHKWLCAPKASGFLYVRPEYQGEVRPTVISHGANRPRASRGRYRTEFDWIGTYDPTPILSVPAAIEFLESLYPGGMQQLMLENRELALQSQTLLCDALKIEPPAPSDMIGSLVAVPLPPLDPPSTSDQDPLQVELFRQHRIELPVFTLPGPDKRILRISLQAYNDLSQVERLCEVLRSRFG